MISELDMVVLTRDLSEHGLQKGDVGTIVHVYNAGRRTRSNLSPPFQGLQWSHVCSGEWKWNIISIEEKISDVAVVTWEGWTEHKIRVI